MGDACDMYTGYDRFGRAIDLRWRVASTNAQLERVQYGFDRAGRRQWRRRLGVRTPLVLPTPPFGPFPTIDGEGDRYYRYDALGQTLAEDFGDLNIPQSAIAGLPNAGMRWTYDATGNIASAQEALPLSSTLLMTRLHDKGNRVTQIGESLPVLTDRAGRITRLRGSDQPDFQMKWDAWGRLVEVKNDAGTVIGSYAYDGLHRRVKRTAAGVTWNVFFNDQWKPIEERRSSHPTLAAIQYYWGARHRDDLIRRDRAPTAGGSVTAEIRYVLMDYFSPLAITSGSTVVERYAFGAFGHRTILNAAGNAVINSSIVAWEFGFQGQFRDSETGLYNYGYRHYAPSLGRFLSKDPIMEDGGNNLYRMAGNSPVNKVDFLGLNELCCSSDAGFTGPPESYDSSTQCCISGQVFDKSEKETVTICFREAALPGGSLANGILGKRHCSAKTAHAETGLGKIGGGVPGQGSEGFTMNIFTEMVDHSGESQQPGQICVPVEVRKCDFESKISKGSNKGPWIPPFNDCNTVMADAVRGSGGDWDKAYNNYLDKNSSHRRVSNDISKAAGPFWLFSGK